ncbi:hypothetical protein BKA64DRAFT_89804 [Cadophora sp. MPI-SDFR-AT-0126]|nr:hypothetical protein BKA64DRAFT_89804 [Leotiomycetes sp. MPI-SDFR-AT-0126]
MARRRQATISGHDHSRSICFLEDAACCKKQVVRGAMEHSICSYYDGCRVSFKDLIATLQHPTRDFGDQIAEPTIRDEHGRFEVWAGNVGARHPPKSRVSLDHRLRESSFYRERVVRLLKDLENTLQNATSLLKARRKPIEECATPLQSPPESDTDESESGSEEQDEGDSSMGAKGNTVELDALRLLLDRKETTVQFPDGIPAAPLSDSFNINIGVTNLNHKTPEMTQLSQGIRSLVGHLYKLSMLIRRPMPHDRLTKCNSIDVSHYEPFDSGHILDCFPTLNEILRLRLGHAMKRRRQYLIYSQRHHHALANPRSAPPLENVSVERLSEIQAGKAISTDKPVPTPPPIDTTNFGMPQSHFGTNTEATQFVPIDNSDEDRPPSDIGTVSTYASTTTSDEKVRIPPRPKGPDGKEMEQFECPYCLHIVETKTARAWKTHVLRDLRPYVCTFEQCNSSETMFENRSEWFSHEMQFHRKNWSCNIQGHETYQHQSEFEDHIRHDHSNWFVESQLPSLIAMFGRPSQAPLASCPFCNDAHQLCKEEDPSQPVLTEEGEPLIRRDPVSVPTGKIKRHIARHLERLALFSIPAPDYGAEDVTSLNSEDVDKASSESRSELLESENQSSISIRPIVQGKRVLIARIDK